VQEITGINHIGLRVNTLERSRVFYEKLGFIFIIGPIGPEPVAIMEHPSGVNINFILNANSGISNNILMDINEKHPGYTHVALTVSNLETVKRFLDEQNITKRKGLSHCPMVLLCCLFEIRIIMLLNSIKTLKNKSGSIS